MTDLFATFDLPTLQDSPNAISLPVSVSGARRRVRRAGPIPGLFGQEAAPASPLAKQARDADLMMNGISGRIGGVSSASAGLRQSLASKLTARMASRGSTLYRLTWRAETTPLRRVFFALRASALQTSDIAYTGWPTPTAKLKAGGEYKDPQKALVRVLGPHANDLRDFAKIVCGWPTPQARDHFPPHKPEYIAKKKAQGHGMQNLSDSVMLAGWATPAARDYCTPNHKSLRERGGGQQGRATEQPSGPHDPWRELEWLDCLDGKSRPTQPGLFPLVTRDTGDVGEIYAYGNAINFVVAREFIAAAMECLD